MAHEKYQSCIQACNECATACEHCATECLHEQDVNDGALHRAGPRLCDDLRGGGAALGKRLRIRGESLSRACADACNKHEMAHCKECAKACYRCADECEKMATLTDASKRAASCEYLVP